MHLAQENVSGLYVKVDDFLCVKMSNCRASAANHGSLQAFGPPDVVLGQVVERGHECAARATFLRTLGKQPTLGYVLLHRIELD